MNQENRRRKWTCRYRQFSPTRSPKNRSEQGQALVEFAFVLLFLLMAIFIIVEASRVLWAWNSVQNAARKASRYGITGQFEPIHQSAAPSPRVASIEAVGREELRGLKLNDNPSANFEDDYYYDVEVYGVNEAGYLIEDFAGDPGQPLVVRVTYRVPIISPILSAIKPSIPVFGQIVENNEQFGQLGSSSQGQGLPPPLPAIPTAGVTPSPSPSPTPGPSSTPTVTNTPVNTATPTATSTPTYCGTHFEGTLVAGDGTIQITGEPGETVNVVDITTGTNMGSTILSAAAGHDCPGFVNFPVPWWHSLQVGHVILVDSTNGSNDSAIVIGGTATPTVAVTNTPTPTSTPTNTPTITPSPTPSNPYIQLSAYCGEGSTIQFDVFGYQWPDNRAVSLFFNNGLQTIIPAGHMGTLPPQTWTFNNLTNGAYEVKGLASGQDIFDPDVVATTIFTVPCPYTPTPPPPTATPTPEAPELNIIAGPDLVGTGLIETFAPLNFTVTISNGGQTDADMPFFVDLFMDSFGTPILAEYAGNIITSTHTNPNSLATDISTGGASLGFATIGNPPNSMELSGDWDNANELSAIADGDYLEFTVVPAAGYTVDLSAIQMDFYRDESASLDQYSVYVDEDPNAGGDNFSTQLGSGTASNIGVFNAVGVDLSSYSFLQGVAVTTTFRIPFWGTSGNKKVFIDNLELIGSAQISGSVGSGSLPITTTIGLVTVDNLPAGISRTLTIPVPNGLPHLSNAYNFTAMVDSDYDVAETDETNNLSSSTLITNVITGTIPNPLPPLTGTYEINGVASAFLNGNWMPQERATIRLFNTTSQLLAEVETATDGSYSIQNLPGGIYTIVACHQVNNDSYQGLRTTLILSFLNPLITADVFMLDQEIGLCN